MLLKVQQINKHGKIAWRSLNKKWDRKWRERKQIDSTLKKKYGKKKKIISLDIFHCYIKMPIKNIHQENPNLNK